MPTHRHPGVYVEETPSGLREITAVRTSTAAFFGIAPGIGAPERTPVPVSSHAEFAAIFAKDAAASTPLMRAVAGFFENGGLRLHVVNLGHGAVTVSAADIAIIAADDDVSLIAAPGFADADTHDALIEACEAGEDRFAVLDAPPDVDSVVDLVRAVSAGGRRPGPGRRGAAAIYAPWILTVDPVDGARVATPPSGHVCGLYARTDAARGVHAAPANAPLIGAVGVTRVLSSSEAGVLGASGVNAIRRLNGEVRVWGARTLSEPASEYQYVPVRRLVTMVSQSIVRGTQWVAFEPNGEGLWAELRRSIDAFLFGLWRQGALVGAKPEHAYFVKCDGTTMTQSDINAGRIIAHIGMAPLRPAEFVIVRIGLSAGGSPNPP